MLSSSDLALVRCLPRPSRSMHFGDVAKTNGGKTKLTKSPKPRDPKRRSRAEWWVLGISISNNIVLTFESGKKSYGVTLKWNLFSGPSSWCCLCSILLNETWRFSLTLILSTNVSIKFKSAANCYQKFGTNIPSFILETITAKFLGMLFWFCLFVCFSNIASHSLRKAKVWALSRSVLPVKMFFFQWKIQKMWCR